MRNKALDPKSNEYVRTFVRSVVDRDFKGKVTVAAKAFGVSFSLLYEFLDAKRGAGMKLLSGVSRHTNVSIDQIVSSPNTKRVAMSSLVRFGDSEQWQEASAEARRVHGKRLPAVAFDAADNLSGLTLPSVIDARTVYNYAKAAWEGMNDVEQAAAFQAQAEAEMAAEDAVAEARLELTGKLGDELSDEHPANDAAVRS